MTEPTSGPTGTIKRTWARLQDASGAVAAQFVQALASFALSVAAARSLGAVGLGTFGILFGAVVLATALASGLVGDSLTVLDRQRPAIRAGLQRVGIVTVLIGAVLGATIAGATGLLGRSAAIMYGAAIGIFIAEDFLRRILMASLRFWSVLLVDLAALIGALSTLGVVSLRGDLDLFAIFLAMLVGQALGIVTGLLLLPVEERWWSRDSHCDVRVVFEFGGWRAAQQGVRPAMLTTMRALVILTAGTAAFGEFEAARLYTAPALLFVNGIGGFLFARYSAGQHRGLRRLVRLADIGAVTISTVVVAVGALAVLLLPSLGELITDRKFGIASLAVFGWAVYAAASGLLMPYGTLSAVTGEHVKVFRLRVVESIVSLLAVVIVLVPGTIAEGWIPIAMSVGPVVLGLALRRDLLRRALREDRPQAAEPSAAGHHQPGAVGP